MKTLELAIQNPTGLHARPAKVLVNLAKQFQSDIRISHKEKWANAKSMVSVLTLGAARGSVVVVEVNGEDEELALAKLEEAIRSGLGDEAHPEEAPAPAPAPAAARIEGAGALSGIPASPGYAIGPLFIHRPLDLEAADLDTLKRSLEDALPLAQEQLAGLHRTMTSRGLAAEAAIFEAQGELLQDEELLEEVRARIASGAAPARAWWGAVSERAKAIGALKDPLLAARADDLRDAGRRVLGLLLGIETKGLQVPEHPVIVAARELSPSEMAGFEPSRVLGFALVNGGPTSHIAILARAQGLPAVVSLPEGLLDLADGITVALDAQGGSLVPEPAPDVVARFEEARGAWLESRRLAQAQADLPALTRDGRHIDVSANAGSARDAEEAVKQRADGIGLLRTEFLFLERATAPSEEEQFEVYRTVAATLGGKPIIVRTLDVGGDKPLAYLPMAPEANPFLGERGLRLCLTHPGLFREQLRAILRAASSGHLQIMFPMVSDLPELREAKALVEEVRVSVGAPLVKVGIMVEVPSAALLADKLAPEVDFFSLGTNDLTQYTLAMDRGHAGLAKRQDGLHPAVLRLIAMTAEAAHRHGRRVDVCGELGSDPAAVPILVGLGVDELSVSLPAVPLVKAQVRSLSHSEAQALARKALECATAQEVRTLVRASLPN